LNISGEFAPANNAALAQKILGEPGATGVVVNSDTNLMELRVQKVAGVVDLTRARSGIMWLIHHQVMDLLQVVQFVSAGELSHVFRC
jgi:hypothetical protein